MEQGSFYFMAAVSICTDFGAPKNKVLTVPTVSPSISKILKAATWVTSKEKYNNR